MPYNDEVNERSDSVAVVLVAVRRKLRASRADSVTGLLFGAEDVWAPSDLERVKALP